MVDWQQSWLERDEKITGDLGWTVSPVEDNPDELRVIFQVFDTSSTRATLVGGIPHKTYMVANRVGTSTGRELERAFVIRVAERNIS